MKNGVNNIQAAAYNGARTVFTAETEMQKGFTDFQKVPLTPVKKLILNSIFTILYYYDSTGSDWVNLICQVVG